LQQSTSGIEWHHWVAILKKFLSQPGTFLLLHPTAQQVCGISFPLTTLFTGDVPLITRQNKSFYN